MILEIKEMVNCLKNMSSVVAVIVFEKFATITLHSTSIV